MEAYRVDGGHEGKYPHLDDGEDGLLYRNLPRVDVSCRQNDLCIRKILDQLVHKVEARNVFNRLDMKMSVKSHAASLTHTV
jgi:hypothetical protein